MDTMQICKYDIWYLDYIEHCSIETHVPVICCPESGYSQSLTEDIAKHGAHLTTNAEAEDDGDPVDEIIYFTTNIDLESTISSEEMYEDLTKCFSHLYPLREGNFNCNKQEYHCHTALELILPLKGHVLSESTSRIAFLEENNLNVAMLVSPAFQGFSSWVALLVETSQWCVDRKDKLKISRIE